MLFVCMCIGFLWFFVSYVGFVFICCDLFCVFFFSFIFFPLYVYPTRQQIGNIHPYGDDLISSLRMFIYRSVGGWRCISIFGPFGVRISATQYMKRMMYAHHDSYSYEVGCIHVYIFDMSRRVFFLFFIGI